MIETRPSPAQSSNLTPHITTRDRSVKRVRACSPHLPYAASANDRQQSHPSNSEPAIRHTAKHGHCHFAARAFGHQKVDGNATGIVHRVAKLAFA